MSASSIGIQMIEPKTATSSKSTPSSPQERNRVNAAFAPEPANQKPPPPPGMGKLVDKTA